MKQTGIYGHLLQYIQAVNAGGSVALPGEERHETHRQPQRGQQHEPQRGQEPHRGQQHEPHRGQEPQLGQGQGRLQDRPRQQLQDRPPRPGQQIQIQSQHIQAPTASQHGNERAVNYFSACIRILGLDEEVAVTEQSLKTAYKKAVLQVHPDKGGTEKEFEAVTRAYAYLGDILKRIHGGRTKESVVEAPTVLESGRGKEAEAWKMVEPVTLNPAKLDMNTFNTMFEKTRIPDPDETGYGDWLKGGDSKEGSSAKSFSGKFNRDVFHKAFEDEQRTRGPSSEGSQGGVMVAQELSLSSRMGYGVELGRSGRDDYTVAPNENGLHFTDLKKAYTTYNTFSQETTGVKVEARSVDAYTTERKKAPAPLSDREMAALHAAEKAMASAEEKRKLRVAQEAIDENSYFERMKRLVIRN